MFWSTAVIASPSLRGAAVDLIALVDQDVIWDAVLKKERTKMELSRLYPNLVESSMSMSPCLPTSSEP